MDLYLGNLSFYHFTFVVRIFSRLHLYKVPAPPPSFLVLARLYAVVGSCGARLYKTQHSHLPMGPPNPSFDPVCYNLSTTPDDVQKAFQTQHDLMTMLPPGAVPTYPPPQVGLGHHRHTSRVPTPLSTGSPSDGSGTSPYDPSTSTRDSTSPTPRASHVYNSRRSIPRKSQLPWLVPRLR